MLLYVTIDCKYYKTHVIGTHASLHESIGCSNMRVPLTVSPLLTNQDTRWILLCNTSTDKNYKKVSVKQSQKYF